MDLFAFPSLSKDLIFVTSIDETFDNTGLQVLSAKKWVINWWLTQATRSFVRQGEDGKTDEGCLIGCHKDLLYGQFV